MSKPTVHIVHHIDTEGPLSEALEDLFPRIEHTLGHPLHLEPTEENLKKLQSREFVFVDAKTDQLLKRLVDPQLMAFKRTWEDVAEMLDRITTPEYRNRFQDSFGHGWVYNWHVLDHVGFEANPRHRLLGYGAIFRHYQSRLMEGDSLQWHFHPVPFCRAANISAISYLNSAHELQQVMCRRLIDHHWFPVVNRAGFHTVRPDSNWWLEQWLPFDASNQAMAGDNTAFKDNVDGRFGDWRGAPDDWSLYHPDWMDWRKKGSMNRTISRCLNMKTRLRNIDSHELERAFSLAERTGKDVYVGITNHDFREMSVEIEEFYEMLKAVAGRNPQVDFAFAETVQAFRKCCGYSENEVAAGKIDFALSWMEDTLEVRLTNGACFGPQPFIGILTRKGEYLTDNFNFGEIGSGKFYYTFDYLTVPRSEVKVLAVASNDKFGNTCIQRLDF